MPIRHGGRLASRASTCPRDHFCRSRIACSPSNVNCLAHRARGATFIVPHHVKRVLADIDTDHGDSRIKLVWHGVLLVFGAPCQLPLLAGPEHGRAIPLAVFGSVHATYRLRDGSVLSSLHGMNDPQPEGHMASYLGRRKFLATLGAAAMWPRAAR